MGPQRWWRASLRGAFDWCQCLRGFCPFIMYVLPPPAGNRDDRRADGRCSNGSQQDPARDRLTSSDIWCPRTNALFRPFLVRIASVGRIGIRLSRRSAVVQSDERGRTHHPDITGIIQLYPLPFIYTVRSDLCEHLPTCGSAAIVRIQYPNMEKRVRLARFTRISARKSPIFD